MGPLARHLLRRAQRALQGSMELGEELLDYDVFRLGDGSTAKFLVSGSAIYLVPSVREAEVLRIPYAHLLEIRFLDLSTKLGVTAPLLVEDDNGRSLLLRPIGRLRGAAALAQRLMQEAHAINPPNRPLLRASGEFHPLLASFAGPTRADFWAWEDGLVAYVGAAEGIKFPWTGDTVRVQTWRELDDGQLCIELFSNMGGAAVFAPGKDREAWKALFQEKDIASES